MYRYRERPNCLSYFQWSPANSDSFFQVFACCVIDKLTVNPIAVYCQLYSRRKYYCYHQNAKLFLLHFKNGNFFNIEKAMLDFSLLLPI